MPLFFIERKTNMQNISHYITEQNILAHTKTDKVETLEEHSDLTLYFLHELMVKNKLQDTLHRIVDEMHYGKEQSLNDSVKDFIIMLFKQAVYLHDLGKINPLFQQKTMKNILRFQSSYKYTDTNHSLLSSLLYLDIFLPQIENKFTDVKTKGFLRRVSFTFSYIISRHHTHLENFGEVNGANDGMDKYLMKLQDLHEKITDTECPYVDFYKEKDRLKTFSFKKLTKLNASKRNISEFEFYLLSKLLFSAMVHCDFKATYAFFKGEKPNSYYLNQKDTKALLNKYQSTPIYKGIKTYSKDDTFFEHAPINALRSDIFLEVEREIKTNSHEQLFYLEAPTGSGKTNNAIHLSLQLLNSHQGLNKILYVFPFNALIEQTKDTLSNVFGKEIGNAYRMQVVNSVTPIVQTNETKDENSKETRDQEEDIDYKEELLRKQMLLYPVTLTSHVNLFNSFFGIGRESNLSFVQLCNSVIVLDEIQGYKNSIWAEIITFFYKISKLMNIKIVLMSATIPDLNFLLDLQEKAVVPRVNLLPNAKKYYLNKLFKNRVELDFSLLKDKCFSLDKLQNIISDIQEKEGPKRILIECISTKTARDLFNKMKENHTKEGRIIVELTGYDSSSYRKKVLSIINEKDEKGIFINKDVVVIATQVIEAGVDIDMDIGLKDISILDAEEQFCGRINRSSLRFGKVFFFHIDEADVVYKGDWRLEQDLNDVDVQRMLIGKEFGRFYELPLQRMKEHKLRYHKQNFESFTYNVKHLNFKEVAKRMKLIDDDSITLFLNYEFYDEDSKETIKGTQVWEDYKKMFYDKIMPFEEKQVELSRLASKMNLFTFSIRTHAKNQEIPCTESIGSVYYIENGEEFMIVDEVTGYKKFDFEKYRNDMNN
ncbi:CRISPR-associated helicase/endonuclease Cas3 [Bacillus thuringiensis]|uniref:CRISPR-associated helicase/endonuclease Cas3 n=2 Tax=Bacillus TaxID=1386 RepID=A0A9X6ZPX8_BACTU|nr:CRISPR-associated helicase/endonuclease Cas3 [Bacillus thuringiensis]PGP14567.1 CRISPR-associated helicase/endonuclease Cas3 [Bacillus cereus]